MSDLPCRADPEKWFSRNYAALGEAVHGCLAHCPRLAECREEPQCTACRIAHNAAGARRKKPKPPPVDVLEERRRQVVIEQRRQVVDDALATRWRRGA